MTVLSVASVRASIRSFFSQTLGDQLRVSCVRYDHFVAQSRQQPAHPGRMRSGLDRYATPPHATEYLLHGFRCG
jgi:hypothetical protein